MTNQLPPPPPRGALSVTLPPGPWPQNGGAKLESVQQLGSSRVNGRVATVYSALAVLSLAAAGIHFAVMGEHFQEYVVFGVFFSLVAWFQALWALGVMVAPTRGTLAVGLVANAAIACVWLISRTTGVPIGPEPGVAEPAALLDVLSTVARTPHRCRLRSVAPSGSILTALWRPANTNAVRWSPRTRSDRPEHDRDCRRGERARARRRAARRDYASRRDNAYRRTVRRTKTTARGRLSYAPPNIPSSFVVNATSRRCSPRHRRAGSSLR